MLLTCLHSFAAHAVGHEACSNYGTYVQFDWRAGLIDKIK